MRFVLLLAAMVVLAIQARPRTGSVQCFKRFQCESHEIGIDNVDTTIMEIMEQHLFQVLSSERGHEVSCEHGCYTANGTVTTFAGRVTKVELKGCIGDRNIERDGSCSIVHVDEWYGRGNMAFCGCHTSMCNSEQTTSAAFPVIPTATVIYLFTVGLCLIWH